MAEYIEREKVTELIDYHQEEYFEAESYFGLLKEGFLRLPSADVQPVVHGKWLDLWIEDDEMTDGGFMVNQCSVCKDEMYYGRPNYCPNCGARMDGA